MRCSTLFSIVLGLGCLAASAATLSTTFTYQGRLNIDGIGANGLYDFRVALFDAPEEGRMVGDRVDVAAVPVTNSLFTLSLDFGLGVFDGAPLWLQVWVRTNGTGSLVSLSPRQALTATPYATYAPGAGTASTVANGAITTAKLADGAVTGSKIGIAAVKPTNLDDGGSAGYRTLQETVGFLSSTTALPFEILSLVTSNSGSAPSLSFTLDGTPLGTVAGFVGEEGLSQPYEFAVQVITPTATLQPNLQIGRAGQVAFARNGRTTRFAGMITGCSLGSYGGTNALYTFRLESPLAWLELSTDYRVFQQKSVPTIVGEVYSEASGHAPALALVEAYKMRDCVIQFGETHLDFFSRLLEDAGIFYFFQTGSGLPALTLGDSPSAWQPAAYPFRYYGNQVTNVPGGAEYILTFQRATRQSSLKSTINSYNFKTPAANLRAVRTAAAGEGDRYEFGSTGETAGENDVIARIRVESFEADRATMRGTANAPDLRPGYTFTLEDQSGANLGGSYLVVSVRHSAMLRLTNGVGRLYYGNEFEVIPAALPYRPALRTPKPTAQPCTAVVTGPAGEEIWTDQYGRVKVKFHWDRYGAQDDGASAWIRTTSLWAGSGRGFFFVPRVGDEVLVQFVQGDPDQPVIAGSLFNGAQMPPVALPADKAVSAIKTRSSKGGTTGSGNEIRFNDRLGEEELYIKAEKNLAISVNNDLTISSGRNMVISAPALQTSALQATGTVSAAIFQGGGPGLTNLPAAALTGTIAESRLPASVARLNASQSFSGANSFLGSVGAGGAAGPEALNINGDARLNNFDLFLRDTGDLNHGLGWYGAGKLFAGINLDGPALFGCDGGGLGTACGSQKLALRWRNNGNVAIDPNGLNTGSLLPGLTFGTAGTEGIASKRNAGGNSLGLDLFTANQVRVAISASGNVGIGKTNPAVLLDVAGPIRTTGAIRSGNETGTPATALYPPDADGLIIRRARSTSSTDGAVVARTDKLTLERDGTTAGLRLSYGAYPGFQVVNCLGLTTNGTTVVYRNTLYNPAAGGRLTLFSDAQRIVHYDISFGDTYSTTPGHTTHVVLDRFDHPSMNDNYLVGTITSTYNQ